MHELIKYAVLSSANVSMQGLSVPVMYKKRLRRDLPGWCVRLAPFASLFISCLWLGALSATKGNKYVTRALYSWVLLITDDG
jgi:hypothetical protein